jgi:adenine-specific DNA-methyltransferase
MARRRTTRVWDLFEEFSREIRTTVAGTRHRAGNRVFEGEYSARLEPIDSSGSREPRNLRFSFPRSPDLIYLDPPYTADNYSRFYHVLEVLVRYDYPRLATDSRGEILRGRYPEIGARFLSGFCQRPRVEEEFRHVIHGAAATGAKLVISYAAPTGLLLKIYARGERNKDPVARLEALCREAYRSVRTERQPLLHSGQGDTNILIEELLVVCREPR